jgi:cephalosporin hydroxylase
LVFKNETVESAVLEASVADWYPHMLKALKEISRGIRSWITLKKPLRRRYYDENYKTSLRQWLIRHQKEIVFDKVTWMGMPVWKNILDAWIYQEIIYEIKPDVIIEIGSRYGGSTLYLANLLDLLDKGIVISIDKDRSVYHLEHDRVKVLTGSSSDPAIISEVDRLCKGKSALVIQDGAHHKEQVLEDLENYSKFVGINSYFIVEDGIVDLFHPGDGLGFDQDGPLKATEAFLRRHSDFICDKSRERYLLTYNPGGFLKRISKKEAGQ